MLVKSVSANGNWSRLDRETPILALRFAVCNEKWRETCFVSVDSCYLFFALYFHVDGTVELNYAVENSFSFPDNSLVTEKGSFRGFDSVSAVFRGIRFHWSRESGKIFISDAFAGRRDFDALTIE